MANPIQISITGGTGHLGTCLILKLLQKGFRVKALYRKTLPKIENPNLTWIKGDLHQKKTLYTLIENTSILVHCAGLISLGEKSKEDLYKINVDGTESVINICINQNVRLVYISSSTAVKETKGEEVFDENRPYKTKGDFTYMWTKALAEKKVLAAVYHHGLDGIILRPTALVGPPDNRPSHFGKSIRDIANNKMPCLTYGGYNIVDVRDVSETIINSFELGRKGESYLIGGNYCTIMQVAELVNPKRKYFYLSLELIIFFLPLINLYKKVFPLNWPITKESLMALKTAPKNMDMSKASRELNHQIRPVSKTIGDLVSSFKNENSP